MKKLRYGSVCSGVECATLAWSPLGWELVFVSEVEPFPCAVLQQRFDCTPPINPLLPEDAHNEKERKTRESWLNKINSMPRVGNVPNEGDFSKIGDKYAGKYDILIGGTPCQSFSVSGNRKGLRGASGLALDYIRLAYQSRVRWVVWENVPGVFSVNSGGDFAAFLSGLTGCRIDVPPTGWKTAGIIPNIRNDRYGIAWRVLDSQYVRVDGFPHAVPQRRRRVFVVGYFGDWRCAAKVLFEKEELFIHNAQIEDGEGRNASIGKECVFETDGHVGKRGGTTARCQRCGSAGEIDVKDVSGSSECDSVIFNCASSHTGPTIYPVKNKSATLTVCGVGYVFRGENKCINDMEDDGYDKDDDRRCFIRWLLPIEYERLMGMPDNHTQIAWNDREPIDCPDAPRYRACGNGFCVNVIRWIGLRIQMVEDFLGQKNDR